MLAPLNFKRISDYVSSTYSEKPLACGENIHLFVNILFYTTLDCIYYVFSLNPINLLPGLRFNGICKLRYLYYYYLFIYVYLVLLLQLLCYICCLYALNLIHIVFFIRIQIKICRKMFCDWYRKIFIFYKI